jgi:Gram-negative porin
MKKYSLGALVAAGLLVGGLTAGSASAADLGGNCCADLEERIAELEATTARKGNRKVSLTISGWVAEQVMWWDDGFESNTYVTDIGSTLDSHFKLTGAAQITPGWSAGYVIHVEAGSNEVRAVDQGAFGNGAPFTTTIDPNGDEGGSGIILLQSFWFVKSDTLGKVSVGLQSQASDNAAILVDGSGSLVPANWVTFTGDGFFLRRSGTGNSLNTFSLGPDNFSVRQKDLAFCNTLGTGVGGDCNGVPLNSVRYDSPTFGGFSVSASWGEDDFWDVAGRYAGEFGGFKVAVAAAYSNMTDGIPGGQDVGYFQVGGYVEHVATGVFAYGAWGKEDAIVAGAPDGEVWYAKAGLRERWTPLGHTVLYGFYGENNDKLNPVLIAEGYHDSQLTNWGGGVVQEIDAAAMSLWVHYQHNEFDLEFGGLGQVPLEDFDTVKAGALINF